MKLTFIKSLLLASLLLAKIAFAQSVRIEASPRAVDSHLTTKLAGETYNNSTHGTLYSLGLTLALNEKASLNLSLGQAQHGRSEERRYKDQLVKVLPRYDLYIFSPLEILYGSAGVALHRFDRAGKNFEGYGAVVGLGLKQGETQGLGFALDLSYEKSLFVQSYRVEGMTAKNSYSALEFGAALTYGF